MQLLQILDVIVYFKDILFFIDANYFLVPVAARLEPLKLGT
jgi:hypothetical protein